MAELPEHEERFIREYVIGQLRDDDDPVTLVQKVGTRRVAGRSHDLYDARTRKGRWWVITDLTNLYSQDDFHSVDTAFTYHLGLMLVLTERERTEMEESRREHAEGAWRRYSQAADSMNDAREAADFQAIGVMCREALLALVRENLDESWLGRVDEPPKVADFKSWSDIFAERLMTGRQRSYLKAVCAKTWDLAVGLQHNPDATPWDAELVLDATVNVLGTFILGIVMRELGAPERCPRCGSYIVTGDGAVTVEDNHEGYRSWRVCGACEWRSEATFSLWSK